MRACRDAIRVGAHRQVADRAGGQHRLDDRGPEPSRRARDDDVPFCEVHGVSARSVRHFQDERFSRRYRVDTSTPRIWAAFGLLPPTDLSTPAM